MCVWGGTISRGEHQHLIIYEDNYPFKAACGCVRQQVRQLLRRNAQTVQKGVFKKERGSQ